MTATTPTGADAVDTVVFDLGGVLIAWDPRRLYRTFGLDDSQVDAILSELDFMAWNHRLDEGADVDEAVAELPAARGAHRRLPGPLRGDPGRPDRGHGRHPGGAR